MMIASRIKAGRQAKALSQAELARAVGVSRVAVSQWESGSTFPTYDRLAAIAQALDMTIGDFIRDPQPRPARPASLPIQTPPVQQSPPKAVEIPPLLEMPRDLPVRGIAACSSADGAFQVDGHTVDYVRRPPALNGIPEAYGIYISGDSMTPKYNPGDLILVHPGRPARPGDYVVLAIQEDPNSEPHTFCKRLIRRHGGVITVEQFNPAHQRDFPENHVTALHRVLEMADLFGV
jgi:phage repressor protein C with HTH and peptisase S24 domain